MASRSNSQTLKGLRGSSSLGRRVSMDYKLTPIKLACKEESVDFD